MINSIYPAVYLAMVGEVNRPPNSPLADVVDTRGTDNQCGQFACDNFLANVLQAPIPVVVVIGTELLPRTATSKLQPRVSYAMEIQALSQTSE